MRSPIVLILILVFVGLTVVLTLHSGWPLILALPVFIPLWQRRRD